MPTLDLTLNFHVCYMRRGSAMRVGAFRSNGEGCRIKVTVYVARPGAATVASKRSRHGHKAQVFKTIDRKASMRRQMQGGQAQGSASNAMCSSRKRKGIDCSMHGACLSMHVSVKGWASCFLSAERAGKCSGMRWHAIACSRARTQIQTHDRFPSPAHIRRATDRARPPGRAAWRRGTARHAGGHSPGTGSRRRAPRPGARPRGPT